MTVEELNVVITAQNHEFNEAINGVINRLDDMDERTRQYGDSASGVFKKVAAAASALGIGKIISDSVMNAGELEQNLGGAEVVFQKSAYSMKNHAKTAFQDMGLSESGYLATANKMGALLKGTGMDAASAAAMSQQAMQRAADVASIMGIDTASAMEAVTGAAKGNFTMMDNLGVAINDTTLQIYAQEHGLGKLETTQQKVNAAMQMFFEKTEYAAGNYARENDTFSGSLSTFRAELDNLTADLGTTLLPTATVLLETARGGLEAVSPLIIGIGEGINGVCQYVNNLSPSAKTMLVIMVLSAITIPAVTKAQLLYNAANGAWKNLLGILIPKEITRANVLKATVGWLAIIAGMLALVADVGATAREMNSGEDMQETADGADTAADSVDGLAESYNGLGAGAESAKKSLADIDTLNVFGGSASTGGVDFGAVVEGAEGASDTVLGLSDDLGGLSEEMDDLNNLSLDGLGDTFSTTFGDIGTGFSTMLDAFNFDSDTQLSSLRVLNEKIKGIFGEDWTNFWGDVGSTIYSAFGEHNNEFERQEALGEIHGWLEDVNSALTGWMGPFGETWTNFWGGIGDALYNGISGADEKLKKSQEFDGNSEGNEGGMTTVIQKSLSEYIHQGIDPEKALEQAKNDYFNAHQGAEEYFEENNVGDIINAKLAYELQKIQLDYGQLIRNADGTFSPAQNDYEYADYSGLGEKSGNYTSPAYGSEQLSASQLKRMENCINLNLNLQTEVDLDGTRIGESVTEYQTREAAPD